MPILINELHVKINVDNDSKTTGRPTLKKDNREQIVAECVEQVMQILSNLKER